MLEACVRANRIIIMQAANTGLTGGSTPSGDDYDREVVIVSTSRIRRIRPIDAGRQVICHAGATLFELENTLRPLGREPHSVIGSSCIGASVVGGVCNSSGGSLIRRGPAYTEMALYARVDDKGDIQLVNHLGVRLGQDPEGVLDRLDRDDFTDDDIDFDSGSVASSRNYAHDVRDVDAGTPARFNADARRLFEASGSAGRAMVFAVRLDTFAAERRPRVFYIGTNDPGELTKLRRHMLAHFADLPLEAEYLHRAAFDIAERYGKDTFLAIRWFGSARLPKLFALKSRVDAIAGRLRILPRNLADRLLQAIGVLFPRHLPRRMREYRDRYEHHLMLRISESGLEEARQFLASVFPSGQGACFECTNEEGANALLHRFVTAGAAIRYRALHPGAVEDIIAIDVALRRNDVEWFEPLPDEIDRFVIDALHYGHFFCHVFHRDYIVRKGANTHDLKRQLLDRLDARGAEYPAEHNVGHSYVAKPALIRHYRELDPCNCLNPGIGLTSKNADWL